MKLNHFTKSINLILSNLHFFLLVIILLIITRIGYWNLILVEGQWDEITYLIAGREILKGKIPYIDFYEIKTVFSFFPYIVASIFENKIIAIRILGSISILISTYLLFLQCRQLSNENIAKITCFLFIGLNSSIEYQSSGITLFIYPFLLLISHTLIFGKKNSNNLFIVGFLTSVVCLMRLNFYPLAIVNFILLIFIFKVNIKEILSYILGGLLPLILFVSVYSSLVNNGFYILYESLFLNMMAAGNNINYYWNSREIIRYLFDDIIGVIFLFSTLTIIFEKNKINKVIYYSFIGTTLSVLIVFTGKFQFNNFFPYMCLVSSISLSYLKIKINLKKFNDKINFNFLKYLKLLLILICFTPILLSSSINIIKNYNLFKKPESRVVKKLFSYDHSNLDKNFVSVEYLKQKIGSNDTIYAYDHFYYLMLNKNLPTNVIHPTNIWRLHKYKNIYGVKNSTEEELSKIFEKDLDWLIIRKEIFDSPSSYPKQILELINSKWNLEETISANKKQYLFKLK